MLATLLNRSNWRPACARPHSSSVAHPSSALRWASLTQTADLQRLEPAWRDLSQRCGSALEQFDWVSSCAELMSDAGQLHVAAAFLEDRLIAAAPLAITRLRGVRRQVLLGEEELGEPANVLVSDAAAAGQLADWLINQGTPLVWQRVPADSPIVSALRTASNGRAVVHQRPAPPAPYLTLDATWSTPENHLSSGRRSDYRRARRRAEEQGPLQTEILTPTLADLGPRLHEALAVEGRSWKGSAGTALVCDARRAAFFERLTQSACRQGTLRIALLRLNGQAIAMQLALLHGGRYWILKVGYDPAFAKCSPGVLLMRETIAWAAAQGLSGFEFLGRNEPWIDQWTNERHECVSLRVYPRSLAGLAALAVDAGARGAAAMQSGLRDAAITLRRSAGRGVQWVASRAARSYISGDTLADAQRVQRQVTARGLSSTIGFWDGDGDAPQTIADEYLRGLDLLAAQPQPGYLSIKLPSLGGDASLLHAVADRAAAKGLRLHFDSLGIEHVDATRKAIERLRQLHPQLPLSLTLPGRWARSPDDADWAAGQGVGVRIVKGQWADPQAPDLDPRAGFMAVVDRLAAQRGAAGGGAPSGPAASAPLTSYPAAALPVCIATHDIELLATALDRLQRAGRPCDVELLYGLPMVHALRMARQQQAPIRIYIPYGAAYLPYAAGKLRSNPRIAWWLLKDAGLAWVRSVAAAAVPFAKSE